MLSGKVEAQTNAPLIESPSHQILTMKKDKSKAKLENVNLFLLDNDKVIFDDIILLLEYFNMQPKCSVYKGKIFRLQNLSYTHLCGKYKILLKILAPYYPYEISRIPIELAYDGSSSSGILGGLHLIEIFLYRGSLFGQNHTILFCTQQG